MTAETVTSDQAIAILLPQGKATQGIQAIAQGDPISVEQAAIIDQDVSDTLDAYAAAGFAGTPPEPDPTQAVVEDADAVDVLSAAGATLAGGVAVVSDSELVGVGLPATAAIVTDGQTIPVTGGTVTITVAANAVTAEFTPE